MNFSVSDTAEYGGMTRGPRVINAEIRKEMKKILAEVQDGSFAQEFINESKSGSVNFNKLRKENQEHGVEVIGAKLRDMMSWLVKK